MQRPIDAGSGGVMTLTREKRLGTPAMNDFKKKRWKLFTSNMNVSTSSRISESLKTFPSSDASMRRSRKANFRFAMTPDLISHKVILRIELFDGITGVEIVILAFIRCFVRNLLFVLHFPFFDHLKQE